MAEPHHAKPLGVRLASAAFVEAAELGDRVVDLGEQTLKGVRAPLRVFTVSGEPRPA